MRLVAAVLAASLAVAAGCVDDDDEPSIPQSGERETTTFKATQFSINTASYNTLPRLLRDARGHDHALVADFLVS